MKQFKTKILTNRKIAPGHYILSFRTPLFREGVRPGQFFNIKINNSLEPFLRRPFGAYGIHKKKIEILYKTVGKATEILSVKKKGEILDVLGPLGNGFDAIYPGSSTRPVPAAKKAILVAGGHGVAPLAALARQLKRHGVKFSVFLGARTKKDIICDKELAKLGAKVYIATDDGSKGSKGLITNLLKKTLFHCVSGNPVPLTQWNRVYACGPKPMLKETAKVAKQYGLSCRISLEEYMACGLGTCLGCAVKTRNGYKMVCKDGPVFDAKEIIWQN